MAKVGFKKRVEILLKTNRFVQKLYSFFGSAFFRFVGLFVKQDKKLILFNSFSGDLINDSPLALYNYISKNYPEYKCVWAVNDPKKGEGYNSVIIDTFKYFKTALKARYWVTNVNIERGLHFKKRKTFYLNTWHGTAIKKIGNLVKGRKDYNFKNMNLLCSDGDFMKDIFVKCFKARKENIFNCGRPREDELLFKDKAQECERARKQLGISNDKIVILYAPTWEDTHGREDILNVKLDLNELKNRLGDKYVILLRAHHLSKQVSQIDYNDQLINVSTYPNINDLYFASDILISDYSSCFFDFALLDKPMLCFAPTYDDYVTNRGVFIDMREDFPFGVIDDFEILVKDILDISDGHVCDKQIEFMKKYVDRPTSSATKFCTEKMLGA